MDTVYTILGIIAILLGIGVGVMNGNIIAIVALLLIIIWVLVAIKSVKKEKTKKKLWREMLNLIAINYKEILEKDTVGSYREEIACHLKKVYTTENEKRYRWTDPTRWDNRKEELEQIILHLDHHAELSKHINEAWSYFLKGWYDECSSHLRKVIRWMILTKVDAEHIIFTGDVMPSIGELIERFYGKNGMWTYHDDMQLINKVGNNASHAFGQREEYYTPSLDKCCSLFRGIANVIPFFFSDCRIQHYLKIADTDVRGYLENFDELIYDGKYNDAAINVRRTLELVVRKYFDKYAIRCLCGHSRDLCGYIDLLNEKQYISEQSKTNMHEIRCITNDGAHEENQTYRLTKEKVIRCYEMIKKEIEILESIN